VESRITPEQCPKYDTCNAPICPLYQHWRKSQHLRGEPSCLYMREMSRDGGHDIVHTAISPELVRAVSEAFEEVVYGIRPLPADHGFGELRRVILRASLKGSKITALNWRHAPR
jgi:hypothetical protein